MRKKIKKIQLTLGYICFISLLMATSYPVFARVMQSNNYRLQLESSDIDAIPQDSIDGLRPVDDFKKALNTGNTTSNLSSNNTNYKLTKSVLIGFLIIFLIIFYFKRIRTKFEIKRKK